MRRVHRISMSVLPCEGTDGHQMHLERQCPDNSDLHDSDACWICFTDDNTDVLVKPCSCPRRVHASCLARWQLQCAGRQEESRCRFCSAALPDWRSNIAPSVPQPAVPVMSIHHNNRTYWLEVHPGTEGQVRFEEEVRHLLGLDDTQSFDITFECKVPGTGNSMELQGLKAFDAAVFCASISAAERAKLDHDIGGIPFDLREASTSSAGSWGTDNGRPAGSARDAPGGRWRGDGASRPAAAARRHGGCGHGRSSTAKRLIVSRMLQRLCFCVGPVNDARAAGPAATAPRARQRAAAVTG